MYQLGVFTRWYGAEMLHGPRWPTRDGWIPFKTFYLLLQVVPNLEARDQLNLVRGQTLAQALVMGGSSGKSKSQLRKLVRNAYPEVRRS